MEEYELGEKVGQGADGAVRRCIHRPTGKEYACKISRREDKLGAAHARSEIALLSRLQGHPNVIRLAAHHEDQDHIHAVLELCTGGDLFDHIQSLRTARCVSEDAPVLTEAESAEAFVAAVHAMSFCHSRGIMHRDVKPENLLLPRPDCRLSDLKLADFGAAVDFTSTKSFNDDDGTYVYQAPEVLSGMPYNEIADIWSLGIVLYFFLFGKLPFTNSTPSLLFCSMHSREFLLQVQNPNPFISCRAKNLLLGLLQVDPSKRLSFNSIITHPWVCPVLHHTLISIDAYVTTKDFKDNDKRLKKSFGKPTILKKPPTPQAKLGQIDFRMETNQNHAQRLAHDDLHNQQGSISPTPLPHCSTPVTKLWSHVTRWLSK